MTDLPEQSVLQQRHARSVPAAQLEMLGKRAAARWGSGEHCSLTCAVTETVKCASIPLSPEQVRRVVEFANTEAYLTEFRKEGEHKVVDFGPSGPANPADVLRDLNDGGGRTVMDSGLGDYKRQPEKRASYDEADSTLEQAFAAKTASAGYPEVNPLSEVIDLRDKLAGEYDHVSSQVSGLEVAYMGLSDQLYGLVKQAAMEGLTLGEVVQAWSAVNEDPAFVKAAFDQFVPKLFQEGVFSTLDEMGDSLMKTAGSKLVNPGHPLVHCYADFCDSLDKLASLREEQEELYEGYTKISSFLQESLRKEATLVGKARKGVGGAAHFLEHKVGLPGYAAKLLPAAAVAGLGYGAYRHIADAAQDAGVTKLIPGTADYNNMRAVRQQGGPFFGGGY
jgi:hypothetical protein